MKASILILISILGRLVPHPANVTPIGAIALVGGAKLSKLWRWTIPFIALILSDVLLQLFFNTPAFSVQSLFVYGSFAVSILLGQLIRGNHRYLRLGVFSIVGSLQFFFVTNFGVWAEGLLYPRTLAGLAECYAMALPFLKNTLLGDLAWSFALFALIDRVQVWTTDLGLGARGQKVI